jgi:hypothetical protein
MVGTELMCTFMEVDEEGGRLVMSARRRMDHGSKTFKVRLRRVPARARLAVQPAFLGQHPGDRCCASPGHHGVRL